MSNTSDAIIPVLSAENDDVYDDASQNQQEISLAQAMQNLLNDDTLKDITLRGNDGKSVRASRCLLAARSQVFHRMLFGNFSESTQAEIDLDYLGSVLQDIVEYTYTDEVEKLTMVASYRTASFIAEGGRDDDATAEDHRRTMDMVHHLVTLANAAEYFQLPKLGQRVLALSLQILHREPLLACLYLTVCREYPGNNQLLQDKAWSILRTNPTRALMRKGILFHLPPTLLQDIVKDQEMAADELQLFQIIQAWESVSMEQGDRIPLVGEITHDDDAIGMNTRKEWAMQLIQAHIRLEFIDPASLSSCVRPSGLVTPPQLLEAFEAQALLAHTEHGIMFERQRLPTIWETSGDAVLSNHGNNIWKSDRLVCAPMRIGGVFTWTFQIEESCVQIRRNGGGHIFLGVATNNNPWTNDAFLGDYDGTWVHCSDGRALINGHTRMSLGGDGPARFDQGSKITFTLDLRRRDKISNGTLTSAVDGKEPILLFHDLLDHIPENDQEVGFVPVASLWSNNWNSQVSIIRFSCS